MKQTLVVILFLAMLFLWLPVEGQIFGKPKEIPESYWDELTRPEKREVRDLVSELAKDNKQLDRQYDIVIPEVPLPIPEGMAMSGDSWYRNFLDIPTYEDSVALNGTFVMAILDTGEPSHKGVVKYKYPGHTSKSYTGEPVVDGHSHGTHVAGVQVYADETDAFGVCMVEASKGHFYQAYYKVCTNGGGCSFSWVATGIRDFTGFYLSDLKPKGIKAGITMSLGGTSQSSDVISAIAEAEAAGILVFAASGNNGKADISFPASAKGVQAIGAHDANGQKASFSNWGNANEDLFACAPGVNILSTCKGDTKCIMSGTSMSTPIEAAMAGKLWIARPEWTAAEVLNHIARNSGDLGDPGYDVKFGHGTPKLSKLIVGLNPEKPDDPGDPPPPPPTMPRPQRGVVFKIDDGYRGTWRAIDNPTPEQITFSDIQVELTSKLPTADMYAQAAKFVHGFFADGKRIVIVPANWDYDTGIFWFGRFMEILAEREGLDLKVISIGGQVPSRANAFFSGNTDGIAAVSVADKGCFVTMESGGNEVSVPCTWFKG